MKPIALTDVSSDLAGIIDRAADDHEPVLITRESGKPAAVLMSLENFASYEETAYLLRSPANAKRLLEAIEELDAGKGTERQLIE